MHTQFLGMCAAVVFTSDTSQWGGGDSDLNWNAGNILADLIQSCQLILSSWKVYLNLLYKFVRLVIKLFICLLTWEGELCVNMQDAVVALLTLGNEL